MIRAIALETSGRIGSVAAVLDGAVLAEREFEHGLQNAAKILPIIDSLCREQNWSPTDLHEIYLSVGPGSFTGLRIGVTIAKALSLSIGVRIVAVPSVRVLVQNAPQEARNAIIVLDAKRGQIFTALFSRSAAGIWVEEEPAHLDRLRDVLARSPRPVHLIGEGIEFHRDEFDSDDSQVVVSDTNAWRARASVVAQLGWEMARRGEFADADRLAPIYIRLPEAEEKWLERNAKSSND